MFQITFSSVNTYFPFKYFLLTAQFCNPSNYGWETLLCPSRQIICGCNICSASMDVCLSLHRTFVSACAHVRAFWFTLLVATNYSTLIQHQFIHLHCACILTHEGLDVGPTGRQLSGCAGLLYSHVLKQESHWIRAAQRATVHLQHP